MSTRQASSMIGLLPDQVVYLRQPIWRGAVRQDPKVAKGNPYITGEYVIGQLNRAFGFDGWDVQILKMDEAEVENSGGRFKATYVCHLELTVYAGVRTIKRHGVGAHSMVSRNLVDVIANGQASAYTKAIKSAAITFGAQFGLNTVRGGRGWQANTQDEHPMPPNLGLEDWRTAWMQQDINAQVGSDDSQNEPNKPEPKVVTSKFMYPLQNLIKSVEDGGPTVEQLLSVLVEIDHKYKDGTEVQTDSREQLLSAIKSHLPSDIEGVRRVLDKVLL
tara:strand:+ start:4732 stop:5556 length:825 start_codon:yes stop_codon:yes gene_type:complete